MTATGKSAFFQRPQNRGRLFSLLVVLLLVEGIAVLVVSASHQFLTERALRQHTGELLRGVVDETRENAHAFLREPERAVSLAAALYRADLLSLGSPEALERYFLEQLAVIPQLDALYFGDLRGQFLFVKRDRGATGDAYVTKRIELSGQGERKVWQTWRDAEFSEQRRAVEPHDRFDPRQRPWYKLAGESEQLVWTDPYTFFTSGHAGVTVAIPVRDAAGELAGVIGADVELHALSEFLNQQKVGLTGEAFILDRNGALLAFPQPVRRPRSGEINATTLAIVGHLRASFPDFANLSVTQFKEIEIKGRRYESVITPLLKSDSKHWVMGVYAPDEELATAIRNAQHESMMLGAVISAVVATTAIVLAMILLGPVRTLQRQAYEDPLTGLLNRRSFDEIAAAKLIEARRARQPLAAIMVDIDCFKPINDNYGHAVGDEVLLAIARRLNRGLSDDDLLARYGGEEFAVVVVDNNARSAVAVAERLCALVGDAPIKTTIGPLAITISLGVAETGAAARTVPDLLHLADQGLLAAKRQGRNRVVLMYSHMSVA